MFVGDIRDLRLIDVSLVDDGSNKNKILGRYMRPGETLIKIRFSTDTNIGAMAIKGELNIYTEKTFCPIDSGNVLAGWSKVYYEDIVVPDSQERSPDVERRCAALMEELPEGTRYIYHTFLSISSRATQNQSAYDLQSKVQDICLRVRGGNMIGGHFKSNIIVIPKGVVEKLLRKSSKSGNFRHE